MNKWDERFFDLADHVRTWSKDPSTQVGCVIADGKKVVSLGFNGYPPNIPDLHLEDRDHKYARVIHAEVNAILNAVGRSVYGCSLYVSPLPPCPECTKLIIAAGIKEVHIRMSAPKENLDRHLKGWYDISMVLLEEAGVSYEVY